MPNASGLSVAIVTKDSAAYVEELLAAARSFADETVIAVDESSTDDTESVCRQYADIVFRIQHPGTVTRTRAWIMEQCSQDWVLWLDDDELPSECLVEALPRMIRDRDLTHYWLQRRWIVDKARSRWIAQWPWWPDWQMRLVRNVPSLLRPPGRLHTHPTVLGDGRFEPSGAIYHLDLVHHSLADRLDKLHRYESLGHGSTMPQFYLPDESVLDTRPIPPDDPPVLARTLPYRSSRAQPASRQAALADLHCVASQHAPFEIEEMRATVVPIDCPRNMEAGATYGVDVDVRNDSRVAWPSPRTGAPWVRLAYHWLRPDGRPYEYEGHRTDLPHTLRPDAQTRLMANVIAPDVPGKYVLQWDVVVEHVAWLSTRGWLTPEIAVRVVREGDGDPGIPLYSGRLLRAVIRDQVPADARIIVVLSDGDEPPRLDDRRVVPIPLATDHGIDCEGSGSASDQIHRLEAFRDDGATYCAVARSALSRLIPSHPLRRHLEARHRTIVWLSEVGGLFALEPQQMHSNTSVDAVDC